MVLLYAWGSGGSGQLGHNDTKDYHEPKVVEFFKDMNEVVISTGGCHSAAIVGGESYMWGDNSFNQITCSHDDEEEEVVKLPQRITCPGIIFKTIECGWQHTVALTTNGSVYAWGRNSEGQCGISSSNNNGIIKTPTAIKSLSNVIQVSAGWKHSLALVSSKVVYAWGSSRHGAVLGSTTTTAEKNVEPTVIVNLQNVKKIRCGWDFSVVALLNNSVRVWGSNKYGQKDCEDIKDVDNIDCGWHHVAAITKDKKLLTWGRNVEGQCGTSVFSKFAKPAVVEFSSDKILFVKTIACGSNHTLVGLSDNSLYSFGWNEHGNLGIDAGNVKKNVCTPTKFKSVLTEEEVALVLVAGGATSMMMIY